MNPAQSEESNQFQNNLPIQVLVHHKATSKSLPITTATKPEIVINAVYSLASGEGHDQKTAATEQAPCVNTMKKNFPILLSSLAQASERPVLAGQEFVSDSPETTLAQNKSVAGSSGSVNVNSSSVDPSSKNQNIQNLPFLISNSKEISTKSKGNDSSTGLLESSIYVTEMSQVKKDQTPEIVDVETEDTEDCMLIEIDLSKRICKFGPAFSGEVVIEDSDEEVGSNKKLTESSEFEKRSSEGNSASSLGNTCGENIVPKSSETTCSVSHSQAQREQSPTLDMEVENIKEEACFEEGVTSDNEDASTEQPGFVSCAETQFGQPQSIPSAESSHYDCKPCSKSFPNRTSLVTHILACHMTKPPPKELLEKLVYPCQNCSQLFKSDSLLVNHECSSCRIKSNLSTKNNPAMSLPAVSNTPALKNLLNKNSTTLKAQQVITPVVTSAPSGQFDTKASVTALIAVKKEIQEMDESENLSLSLLKKKELEVPKSIPKETPVTKISQSPDTVNRKKDSSIDATSSAANVTADKSAQKEPLKPKGGEKTVWCYACDSWFTTYTELKLHLKIKPQCKVTNDEFYLQNVKNKPYQGRTSYATKTTTDTKSQPAKSSDATASTMANKSSVLGNDQLVTLAKPDLNRNDGKKSEQVIKVEPLKIKIGPSYCFNKQKRVSAQAANLPSEDNPKVNDTMETKKNLCKEGSNDSSTEVNSIKFEPGQNAPIDKKINRAVVQLKSMSVMCKVCQKAFTDEQSLVKHLENTPKCLNSNKESEQCKSCKSWFVNSDSLRKHVLMSESCQVGTSKEIATDNLPNDPIKERVDQQTLSGCVKIDLSSDDSDDVEELCSSEESDVEYKCRHCTMIFAQKSQCKKHMQTSHGQPWKSTNSTERGQKMQCKSCTRKFENITLFQAHLLQNKFCFLTMTHCFWNSVQNENHVCLLCTKIFSSDKMLRRHCFKNMACRLSYTSQVLKELVNDNTSSPVLVTNLVTNNSPVEKSMLPMRNEDVPKPVVAEVSSSVQDLNVSSSVSATPNTVKASNSGSGTTRNANKVCKSCGANYVTFIDHVLKEDACCAYYASHMEESPTVSFCFRCKKQFQNKRLFKFHICSNASGEMREAEASTISVNKNVASQLSAKLNLTTHVSSQEEFSCMICQTKFPILRQLQEHSYQHTDLISHVCQRCNMSFRHYNQVVSHMAFHIRMDKESESTSKQAANRPTNTAQAELTSVSDNQSQKTEAVQDYSHSCPVCLQLFKSKEAVEDHKKKHEISKTSAKKKRLVNVPASKLDPLPATEKNIISKFPQLCGCCNKNLNSLTDKRKHISCSARCRKALSNLDGKKEKISQVEDNNSAKNNYPLQNHNSCLPSKGSVKCLFCLEVFICEQDKLKHISQSQCCKSVLKFVLDNKIYAITRADSNVNSKLQYKKCEFCLKIVEDKVAHLLKSPCMKALEDAIIAYKSNTTVNISSINNQGVTNKPSYSCEICKQIFGTKGSLSCHKRKKHKGMNHISSSPLVASGKQEQLPDVPSDHHLYCFKCHSFLETENDVRLHLQLSHTRKLLSRGTMKNAVFTPGKLKCKICDIKYLGIQKGRLVNHMFLKHNQGTSKLLDLQEELLNIKNVTSSPGDTSQKTSKQFPSYSVFTCTFCGMIVSHKGKNSHFQVHMNKILKAVKKKSDVPMYAFSRETCPFCKKVYLSRKTLRIHLLQHNVNDIVNPGTYKLHSGLIKCLVCKRFFSSRNTLKHHALTTHKKIFLEDPLIFGVKSSISATKAKKTELKIKNPASYQCDICSQVFSNKSTFKFHKMFHGESSTKLEDSYELTPNEYERSNTSFSESPALLHRSTGDSRTIPKKKTKVAVVKNRKVVVKKEIIVDESGTDMIAMTSDENKHWFVNKSSHHKNENESCRVECWKGFSLRPLHKAILNCHLCEIKIRKDEYHDHLLNDHKCREDRIHSCSFCDLKFPTSGLAEEHLKQCSLDSQCILCLEQLQSIKLLKNHVVQGHKHTWSDYISKFGVSTKIGIDNGGLKIASTSTEIGSVYSPRTCPVCEATFNEKSAYNSHLEEHTKTCTVSLPKLDENLMAVPKPISRDKPLSLSAPASLPSVSSGSVLSDGSAPNFKVFQSHSSGYFKLILKSEKLNEVPSDKAGPLCEQYQGASDYLENTGLAIKQHKKASSVSSVSGVSKSSKIVKAKKRAIITSSSSEDDCRLPKAIKLSPPSDPLNSSGTFNEEI